jgi:ankyrin repeat protein
MGATALGVTCVYGKIELTKLLLEAGANVDGPSTAPFTPLIFASLQGHEKVVQLLLDKGAEIDRTCTIPEACGALISSFPCIFPFSPCGSNQP